MEEEQGNNKVHRRIGKADRRRYARKGNCFKVT
jgi:hypothetical protein